MVISFKSNFLVVVINLVLKILFVKVSSGIQDSHVISELIFSKFFYTESKFAQSSHQI